MTDTQELTIIIKGKGAEKVQAALDKLEGRAGKADAIGARLGQTLKFAGVVVAIKLVSDAIGGIVNAGSEAAETASLVSASFKGATDDIKQWAESSSASIVQTRLETEKQAATYFNIAQGMKLSADASLDLSKNMTNLTADVASFFNLSPDEAFVKLSAALTGEYDAMKKLGVVLKASTVDHEALAMTGKKAASELSEADRVAARYKLILEGLGPAIGDVERTSDGWANTIRNLNARKQELRQTLGLIIADSPGLKAAIGGMSDMFKQVVDGVVKWIEKNPELVDQLTGDLGLALTYIAEAVATLVLNLSELFIVIDIGIKSLQFLAAVAQGNVVDMANLGLSINRLEGAVGALREGADQMHGMFADMRLNIKGAKREADDTSESIEQLGDAGAEAAEQLTNTSKAAEDMAKKIAGGAKKQAKELGDELKQTAKHTRELESAFDRACRRADCVLGIVEKIVKMRIMIAAAAAGDYAAALGVGGSASAAPGEPAGGTGSSEYITTPGGGGGPGGAIVAAGGAQTTTRQASPGDLKRARQRANEALGYARYDITLSDLPYYTGKAVASAVTDAMRRPSMQTRLASIGV